MRLQLFLSSTKVKQELVNKEGKRAMTQGKVEQSDRHPKAIFPIHLTTDSG